MQITPEEIAKVSSLITSVLAAFTALLVFSGRIRGAVGKWLMGDLEKDIKELKGIIQGHARDLQTLMGERGRIETLEVKMNVFWGVIERNAADILHRDDTPMIDRLLEKLKEGTITWKECDALAEAAKRMIEDDRYDRVAAVMLLATLEARKADAYH